MKRERYSKKYVDNRDWKEYNEKLKDRGEVYIDLSFITSWEKEVEKQNKNKEGARFQYPESLMVFAATLHVLRHMDYRGIEGYLKGLSKLIPFKVPDYSTICRRVNKLKIDLKKTLRKYEGQDVVICLDSTGVKVTNRGEWMRQKWKVRRGWIKVHVAVEDKNKQVVGITITNEEVSDTKEFQNLVNQSIKNVQKNQNKVVQVIADCAYDSNENFRILEAKGIRPCIKIRKPPPTFRSKKPRKKYAKEYYKLGYKKWRDTYEYGKRWYSEIPHSVVKRKCGEYVRATKLENMYQEVRLKYLFYNAMLKYDMNQEPLCLSLTSFK